MKKLRLLWVMAAAFMLSLTYTSCDELDGLLDDKKNEEASGEEAFFPKAFADKEVAAWYSLTEKEKDKTKTMAVFLFTDKTFVVTKNKVHADGRYERSIEATGTYVLEGDYKNGTAKVIVLPDNGEAQGEMNIVIENGKLTTDKEEGVFTIQDNAKVPKASDPASGNNNQGGDNNQGGGDQGDGSGAFFPKSYAGKSVSAWYSYSGSDSGDGIEMKYVAAIYFFGDGTFVATSNVAVSGPTGDSFERTIGAEGGYRIIEGDFNTGKISITYDGDKSMTVEIENGQLKAIDLEDGSVTIYFKQDPGKTPEPSDPTENGNQNGNQGGDQGDSDVPAFFPTSYAGKPVIAWYSFVTSNPVETIVEAVFLFTDNTLIVTERKIHSQDNMSEERHVWLRGSYTITSDVDYDNFTADVITDEQRKMNITAVNGYLVLEYNSDMTFKRRQLKDIPDPLDSTDGYQGDDNGDDNGGEGQSDANLAAWYTSTQTYNNREYTIAIILLEDGTVAFTSTPVPDGSGTLVMTEIMGVGTYTILDGDLTNGTVQIVMYGEPQIFSASNGVVVTVDNGAEMTYFQQDNAKYDGPTDFSDYNGDDNGDDGDDDGDDDDDDGDVFDYSQMKVYFPSEYADKTVAAWYVGMSQDENSNNLEAVFLFSDGTLSVTKSSYYTEPSGKKPEFSETTKGTYRMIEGDFTEGRADVNSKDGSFVVVITDSSMTVMETTFYLTPNEIMSEMTTSGNSK